MNASSGHDDFSAHPDLRLGASPDALSTVGPTGATAILDPGSGQFYSLNEIGGRVWELLHGGTTFRAIVEQLRNEYDVTADLLAVDVERLLQQFAEVGLLEAGGEANGKR